MSDKSYQQKLIELLKENNEEFKELPNLDFSLVNLLILLANETEVKQIPTYDTKNLNPLKLRQECRRQVKKLGLRKVNKATDKLYLAVLKSLKTGDLDTVRTTLQEILVYMNPAKFMSSLPPELLKEIQNMLNDENLTNNLVESLNAIEENEESVKQEQNNEHNGSSVDREVQTENS